MSSWYEAYAEFGEALQEEKLTASQRGVPRGDALLRGPEPIRPIEPRYPREALQRGARAYVMLEVFISAGGAVEEVLVVDDDGEPQLAAAAQEAVQSTPFRPAQTPKGPAESRITLRVRFTFE